MDFGTLDRRIRIESPTVTQDASFGTSVIAWVLHAEIAASVIDVLPGKAEAQNGALVMALRPAKVRCRYVPGVTAAMRVVVVDRGGAVMQIVSGPAEVGRKEGLEMLVQQYSTTGDSA